MVEGERKEVAAAAAAGAAGTSGEGEDGGARKELEAVICASTVGNYDQEKNSIFFSFFFVVHQRKLLLDPLYLQHDALLIFLQLLGRRFVSTAAPSRGRYGGGVVLILNAGGILKKGDCLLVSQIVHYEK